VANQFQKSGEDQTKGNREMSVCEMQREVMRARTQYIAARKDFLHGLQAARETGVKLMPDLYTTDTRLPSRVSLGGLYCALIRKIEVKQLGAQPAPLPTEQHPVEAVPDRGAGAPPLKPTVPAATATPQNPVPGRISTTGDASPSAQIAPSMLEVTRIRLADARATIDGLEIEIHKKFALAVACFVFVMLGAPIALRFPRGGVGLTLGVSLFVFALYYIGLTAGAAAASAGLLPPYIAMWAANVIFALVAIIMLWRMGNEGSTARGGNMAEAWSNLKSRVTELLRRAHLLRERRSET
jgi:lipopolysaccharide export system permease protein